MAEEFGLGAGVDPRSIEPLDFGDPQDAAAIDADPNSPEALLGAVLAGLSQAADDLGLSDPLDLVDALASDFSDGVFNGEAGGQPVQVNGTTLSPTQATTDLAASTEDFLDSPQNESTTEADDFNGLITAVQTQDVAPPGVNRAPSFDSIADVLVASGAGVQQVQITGVSPGGGESQTVTVTATSSAPAVAANPSITGSRTTRTLAFTPLSAGTTTITVTAQDSGGTSNGGVDTATRTFVIVSGAAPAITSALPPTDAQLGVAYSHPITTTGTPARTLSLSGNPPWLTLSGGTLSGTPGPTHVGVASNVTITSTNGITPAATQLVTITVFAPPAITSTPGLQATVGTQYTYTIQVTGFPAPTVVVTGLPTWLTRTGNVLQGTPAVGDLGPSVTITVTAQDNGHGADAVQPFQINVNPQLPAGQWNGSNWDAASWSN